jgi:hypothetical protein
MVPMQVGGLTESWPFPDTIFDCGSEMACLFLGALRSWIFCVDMMFNSNCNMQVVRAI